MKFPTSLLTTRAVVLILQLQPSQSFLHKNRNIYPTQLRYLKIRLLVNDIILNLFYIRNVHEDAHSIANRLNQDIPFALINPGNDSLKFMPIISS